MGKGWNVRPGGSAKAEGSYEDGSLPLVAFYLGDESYATYCSWQIQSLPTPTLNEHEMLNEHFLPQANQHHRSDKTQS